MNEMEEIEKGGDQAPCPFCKVPRVQRSDYIRCCRCGINWLKGENLDKNPKIDRYNAMKEANTKR